MKDRLGFRLMFISSGNPAGLRNLPAIVEKACKAGVKAVQIREKDMEETEFQKLLLDTKRLIQKYKAKLIINTGNTAKYKLKPDGLHYPSRVLDSKTIQHAGIGVIQGTSVHSVSEAKKAEKAGFDYILFGPVFRTPAKVKYGSPQGIEMLEKVCSSVKIPVIAVGGITPARVKKCLNAGADGVAVIRAIAKSSNINKTVMEFKKELGKL